MPACLSSPGLEHFKVLIELLIIYLSLDLIDQEGADIDKDNISGKAQRQKDAAFKPFAYKGESGIYSRTDQHPRYLLKSTSISFIKIAKQINLQIAYDIAGKDHLPHMQYPGFRSARTQSEHAVKEQLRKEIQAGLKFYPNLPCEISLK